MRSNLNFDENGWLFADPHANVIHDVSEDDLWLLWSFAEQEDIWVESLTNEVTEYERLKKEGVVVPKQDFIIEQARIEGIGGTVVQYPFGDRIITFPSKPHLYRGERRQYQESVATLRRDIKEAESTREREMLAAVAHMRKWQFARLLTTINIVPFWSVKLSDINWDALAQHYGLSTFLLDLTNNFRAALFFATCEYDATTDSYRPLEQADIDSGEHSRYGFIFHVPNWAVDAMEAESFMKWMKQYDSCDSWRRDSVQSGFYDGMAFQIGCQPMQRCERQAGYVYPMKYAHPLQEESSFEKLRFRQSVELSRKVYDAMDGGRKVFPNEGITELREVIQQIRSSTEFADEDLVLAYDRNGIDRGVYPTVDSLRCDLNGYSLPEGKLTFVDEAAIDVPQELIDRVNSRYDGVDIIAQVGGYIHMKPDDRRYFDQRSIELHGEII